MQYESLKYVSFSVQTVAKSSKMIPVMLCTRLLRQRAYQATDYLLAISISFGSSVFLLSGDVRAQQAEETTEILLWGLLSLVTYLGFDGFTSTLQESLFREHQMTIYNQMFYTACVSTGFSFVGAWPP